MTFAAVTAGVPPFDHIIWFSARDIDLRLSGPSDVHASVSDLQTIKVKFTKLFGNLGVQGGPDFLADALQKPAHVGSKGILFIFDNFETLSSIAELHRYIDQHTHLPNKALLTSRERAFVAD